MPSRSSGKFWAESAIDDGTPHNPELHIMAQRVDGKLSRDTCEFKPVLQSELHLAGAKPFVFTGTEQWRSIGEHVGIYVQTEESAKRCVQEDHLFTSTFCANSDSFLTEVHIASVQTDQRAEPDASTEQDREHRVVSFGNGGVGVCDRAEQSFRLVRRQIARYSPVGRRRANQPCRIVCEITSIREEAEENPERSLGSVDGQGGPHLTVPIGEEARERVGSDRRDINIPLEPALKLAQIPQVGLPRALAFAVCPELRVKALDRCRELHGFTPLQSDSQATSMNALSANTVNEIMLEIGWLRQLSGRCCPTVRNVAATQALCAPISREVAIYA